MSFTHTRDGKDRSIELVKRSLLQHDSLPFFDALTVEQIQQAFDEEGVSFGDTHSEFGSNSMSDDGGIIYSIGVTLWAMLSQAIFTDVQRSCRAAVQRVAVYYSLLGVDVSSTNTSAYCRVRAKIPEGVIQRLAVGVAERCEATVPDEWRWKGLRALVVDGTTFSMPDTQHNQAEYPQSSAQAEGLGFPIMRAIALTSLATGMVLGLATGAYAGKHTGETALLRTLFDKLRHGDLILADRYFGTTDFCGGLRLGKRDQIVTWAKPQKPEWLEQEDYDRLPDQLEIREIEVKVNVPGFRTESLVVVTSLRDHKRYPRNEIATLYRRRWVVELELRDIKTTMDLDVLRRTRPEWVRQELWTGLLAYNLIRQSMLQSALGGEVQPDQLSFAASLQMLTNTWVLAAVPPIMSASDYDRLIALRLLNGYSHRVADRPNRIEPRAVKRRPSPIALLAEPRETARRKLVH